MKQTNDTMKEMMVQQAATMNNLMAVVMCSNEEQRYEGKASRVPQNINPTSTPADNTMTNSQQSMELQEDKTARRQRWFSNTFNTYTTRTK